MKHPHTLSFHLAKRLLTGATLLLVLTMGIISCGTPSSDKAKEGDLQAGAAPTTTTGFSMACYRIDSSLVKAWKDSGWLKPGAGTTNRILLQLSTEDAAGIGSNMGLLCFPASSNSDAKGAGARLKPDTTCVPLKLSGPVNLTNNFIKLSDLKITDPSGNLISFDYILLRPSVTNYPPYLNFNVSVVRNAAAEETLSGKGSWPCPVYCF